MDGRKLVRLSRPAKAGATKTEEEVNFYMLALIINPDPNAK